MYSIEGNFAPSWRLGRRLEREAASASVTQFNDSARRNVDVSGAVDGPNHILSLRGGCAGKSIKTTLEFPITDSEPERLNPQPSTLNPQP